MQERKAASGPSWAYWRNREWAYAEKGLALKQNLHAKMKKNLKGQGKCFSVPCVTRFQAAARRRLLPPVYPEFGAHRTIFCGTSSRNNGFSPWKIALWPRVPMHGHFLHLRAGGGSFACDGLRACAAYDSNCGLCSMRSLLDCSGRLQESSRKHALLQAAYLPRRKNTVAHSFSPFSFILGIVSPAKRKSKFFAAGASILHMPI